MYLSSKAGEIRVECEGVRPNELANQLAHRALVDEGIREYKQKARSRSIQEFYNRYHGKTFAMIMGKDGFINKNINEVII